MKKQKTNSRQSTASSLGRDGRLSRKLRLKKPGSVRMTPPLGMQFESLAGRHEGGAYLGGTNQPEPEQTANEYLGMNDAEKIAYIRRLVRDKHLVEDRELSDAIRADRRRGMSRGSRERDDQTLDHNRAKGKQAFRSGRGSRVEEAFVDGPTDLWRPGPRHLPPPSPLRPEQQKRASAWDHESRPLTLPPWQALYLHEVEGLSFANVGLRLRPNRTKRHVQALIDEARSRIRKSNIFK